LPTPQASLRVEVFKTMSAPCAPSAAVVSRRRILFVGDPEALPALSPFLEDDGFSLVYAHDAEEAKRMMAATPPDLVLVDAPSISSHPAGPLWTSVSRAGLPLMLLSGGGEAERIAALEFGAADCVTKPLNAREVRARIKSILRRRYETVFALRDENGDAGRDPIRVGELAVDPGTTKVMVGQDEVPLTATEFRLLWVLAEHAGAVLTRESLIRLAVRDPLAIYDRTLDRHISNLRRKLGPRAGGAIVTAKGFGYKLVPQHA
jgi:DNA-binding response OmpR family regulator